MKSHLLQVVLVAIVAAMFLYLLESRTAQSSYTDLDSVVDTLVDSGINEPLDLESPGFYERRTIVSTTDVNAGFSKAIISSLLALDRVDPATPIDLYLRTEGGWEADAFAVIDTIQSIQAPVNVHGIGEVHSAGAMILAAGTGKRIVYENTLLGFHEAGADEEKMFENRYLDFWKKHGNLPEKWLNSREEEMRYFTAEEAIEMGVADELRRNE